MAYCCSVALASSQVSRDDGLEVLLAPVYNPVCSIELFKVEPDPFPVTWDWHPVVVNALVGDVRQMLGVVKQRDVLEEWAKEQHLTARRAKPSEWRVGAKGVLVGMGAQQALRGCRHKTSSGRRPGRT